MGERVSLSNFDHLFKRQKVTFVPNSKIADFLFPKEVPKDPASQIWIARVINDLYRELLSRAEYSTRRRIMYPEGGPHVETSDPEIMEKIREIPPPQLAEWLYQFFLEDLVAPGRRTSPGDRWNESYEQIRQPRMRENRGGFDRER